VNNCTIALNAFTTTDAIAIQARTQIHTRSVTNAEKTFHKAKSIFHNAIARSVTVLAIAIKIVAKNFGIAVKTCTNQENIKESHFCQFHLNNSMNQFMIDQRPPKTSLNKAHNAIKVVLKADEITDKTAKNMTFIQSKTNFR
jgi:hypothetical protein